MTSAEMEAVENALRELQDAMANFVALYHHEMGLVVRNNSATFDGFARPTLQRLVTAVSNSAAAIDPWSPQSPPPQAELGVDFARGRDYSATVMITQTTQAELERALEKVLERALESFNRSLNEALRRVRWG